MQKDDRRTRANLAIDIGKAWRLPRPLDTDAMHQAAQRLVGKYGADEVEIGADLREPEREWLAAVLRAWAAGGDKRPTSPSTSSDSQDED